MGKQSTTRKGKYRWIGFWTAMSIGVAIIIHLLFNLEAACPFFIAKWTAGDILTYFSTVSLGLLAMWQNQKNLVEQIEQFEFTVKPQIQCYLSCYKSPDKTPYLVLVTENIGKTIARNISLKITWPEGAKESEFYAEMQKLKDTSFTLAPGARLSTPITWEKNKSYFIDGVITIDGKYNYISSKGEKFEGSIEHCELTIKEFDLFNAINIVGGKNGQAENAHAE